MRRSHWALAVLGMAVLAPPAWAQTVKVAAGDVEDTRTSDERWGVLSVELKLSGDAVADVKGLRVKLKSAKDDQGTVLFKPEPTEKAKDFEEFSADRRPGPSLQLRTPARGAATIDVSGELELFLPKRDPGTKQKVDGYQARLDKPIANAALKSAKVEIIPLSPAEYKARSAKHKPSPEEIAAEGRKHGASEKEIQQMIQMVEALAALGGGEDLTETNATFEVKDPDGKLLGLEVADREGQEIHSTGRSTSGGRESKLVKLDLGQKAPADASLLLTVRTPKAMVTVPFAWKEVPLP
jgi:hypothetical protein